MKTVKNVTLGFTVLVPGCPEDATEFDKLAGKVGAANEEATKNVIYRSWNPEFKGKLVDAIIKSTGIARAGTGKFLPDKKNGDKGAEILEAEPKYIERVLAQGHTIVSLQPIADEVAAATAFDPSASTRGGGRVGKEYLDLADGVVANPDGKLEARIERLLGLNPTFGDVERYNEGDEIPAGGYAVGTITRESLGSLIKANTIRKAGEDLA